MCRVMEEKDKFDLNLKDGYWDRGAWKGRESTAGREVDVIKDSTSFIFLLKKSSVIFYAYFYMLLSSNRL